MSDININTTRKSHSMLGDLFKRIIKEKPLGTVGMFIVLTLCFVGIFADVLAPYGINDINLPEGLKPPSSQYILGTDDLGRDLLSRIIYGARISMIVGICATALELVVGIIIGVLSGFFGGRFDLFVQRFVDAWMCLPWIFVILSLMAVLSGGLAQVVFVLGIHRGISGSRIIRSAVIGIKDHTYMAAAMSTGCSTWGVVRKHILPNIMAPIIIMFTISMGTMILAEASLSFLGFGVPPPAPSWGGMLSGEARKYMYTAPWLAIWPGLALSVVIFGINMFGDAVRDILDPRLRGGVGSYSLKRKRVRIKKEVFNKSIYHE